MGCTISPDEIRRVKALGFLNNKGTDLFNGRIITVNGKITAEQAKVISEAADRPDDRPHPYIVSLIKSFVPDVRFTDAVSIPGVVEPEYHESVHIELA